MSLWDLEACLKSEFSTKTCSVPKEWQADCSGTIIKAHTVPRSESLKQIAREGHVYSFVMSMKNLEQNSGKLLPTLNGISKASTFTGFCSKHDNSIFVPLEDEKFRGTSEQCFLLSYRAFSRECFTKAAQARTLVTQLRSMDRGKSPATQRMIQEFSQLHMAGVSSGVRDNEARKEVFEKLLTSRDCSSLRALIFECGEAPPVMCSGGFSPEWDFEGNKLEDLAILSRKPDLITLNSFYSGTSGWVVLTWLDGESYSEQLARSLAKQPEESLGNAIIRLMFEHTENVHMSPVWWESLSAAQRGALVQRMAASANPFEGRRKDFLADDGISFPFCTIKSVSLSTGAYK